MAVNNLNVPGVGIQPSLIDAKGDLLVGTGNDAIDRLGVTGPTGSVLVTDAGETTGLKWVDPGTVGGLVHIETQNPSGVTSVNFNNVFSSTYRNYRIVATLRTTNTVGAGLNLRFRSGTTDNTNSQYAVSVIFNTGTGGPSRTYVTNGTSGAIGSTGLYLGTLSLDLFDPFITDYSGWSSLYQNWSTAAETGSTWGYVNNQSSYDGLTILSASVFTGEISIYGYRK